MILSIKQLNNNNLIIKELDTKTDLKTYTFFSYDTKIATFRELKENDFELTLTNKWDYSRTTLKYLYAFIDTLNNDFKNNSITILANNLKNETNKKEYIKYCLDRDLIDLK